MSSAAFTITAIMDDPSRSNVVLDAATAVGANVIRRASPGEARAVAGLGARLFREAYGPTHPEPTLSRYLAESFGLASVERILTDPDATLLVVEGASSDGFVGYAHLRMGAPDASSSTVLTRALPGQRPLEIVRFYIGAEHHGRGLALALMSACDAEARARGADVLWLQAWQEAGRAVAFYEKAGLRRIGTTVFHFGERVDHDFVMARPVAAAEPSARSSSQAGD